ncbi:MAG: hypothetical protein JNK23_15065 [Opitutaceae bacterium]|nr:hypothetical protein [Opitutaceae bacterium]
MNDKRERMAQAQAIRAWRLAGPALDALRYEEIRNCDAAGIAAVIPAADLLVRLGVVISAETGLVEQQAWFVKLRHARSA